MKINFKLGSLVISGPVYEETFEKRVTHASLDDESEKETWYRLFGEEYIVRFAVNLTSEPVTFLIYIYKINDLIDLVHRYPFGREVVDPALALVPEAGERLGWKKAGKEVLKVLENFGFMINDQETDDKIQ